MIKHGIIIILFVGVLVWLLANPTKLENSQTNSTAQTEQPNNPLDWPMVAHLRTAHSLTVASEPPADIILKTQDQQAELTLSDALLARLPQTALQDLEMDAPTRTMPLAKLNSFFPMFHAYLALHPLKDATQNPAPTPAQVPGQS